MKINMQAPWEINPYLAEVIRERTERLALVNNRIQHVDVFLKLGETVGVEDKLVEMRLRAPGPELFAQAVADTYEKAVAAASAKLRAQLVKQKEKREERYHGG